MRFHSADYVPRSKEGRKSKVEGVTHTKLAAQKFTQDLYSFSICQIRSVFLFIFVTVSPTLFFSFSLFRRSQVLFFFFFFKLFSHVLHQWTFSSLEFQGMQFLMHKFAIGMKRRFLVLKKIRLGEADSQLPPTREPMEHSPSPAGS